MPYTILVVDDDGDFRAEFRALLDGYEIVEARDGEEALRVLGGPHEIDLVVLDVVLPGRRGTEVLREMKRRSPEMGIVILTGHGSKDVAVEALKGRADEFLEKPLDPAEARRAIERLLSRRDGGDRIAEEGIAEKIEHVKRFVARNWNKKVTLADAASVVCLSPKYLSRVFKERAGCGFNEHYLAVKMRAAREMLRGTQLTVEQISDRIGYQNAESFIRIFRKITGRTPTECRSGTRRRAGRGRRKGARR